MKYELKMSQAAEVLGVSESRVSQLVSAGTLDSITRGGRRFVSRESVEEYRASGSKVGRPPKTRSGETRLVLMNANYPVMRLAYDSRRDDCLSATEVLDADRCPWGVLTSGDNPKRRELNEWWRGRSIPHARPGIDSKLLQLKLSEAYEIPVANLGLSLSDCYWVWREDAGDMPSWGDVNFYENSFDERTSDDWDWWLSNVGLNSPDNTSDGALPKKWTMRDGKRVLLKGCLTDDQRPYNEVVATRLYQRLLNPSEYVPYEVVDTMGGTACACENFLTGREEYIPASFVMATMGNVRGATFYDRFCNYAEKLGVLGYRTTLSKMLACDAMLANSDRHRGNFGFIRNVDTLELRAAPLFDTGNSLWFNKTAHQVMAEDWSYVARPFGPEPARQLALIEDASWFDGSKLEGFVAEATDILTESSYAGTGERLRYIEKGLLKQVEQVSNLLEVVRYR